jgi:hypothetical protein
MLQSCACSYWLSLHVELEPLTFDGDYHLEFLQEASISLMLDQKTEYMTFENKIQLYIAQMTNCRI